MGGGMGYGPGLPDDLLWLNLIYVHTINNIYLFVAKVTLNSGEREGDAVAESSTESQASHKHKQEEENL